MEILNFIGGEFCPAESKKTFVKLSPFDGSELAYVASSDAMDVIKALQAAKKAFPGFIAFNREQRSALLMALAEYIHIRSDEISYQEALYQGLPKEFVRTHSVQAAVKTLRHYSQAVLQDLPANKSVHPTGIVGIVASWNLSLRLIVERMAAALAAGDVVLIKVSEQSPITAKLLGEAAQAVQIPAGVLNILQGSGEVAQVIAAHPSVRAVTAVGSPQTLEALAKIGAQHLKKVQLLGGAKNSSIVLSDCDYKTKIPEIMRTFLLGQGQLCWNTSRIFVPESNHKEFIELIAEYLNQLKPLESPNEISDWTPLISKANVERIDRRVREAVDEHGKVIWGGSALDHAGFYFKPTVMLDLPNCSVLQQEELQGPLLLVTPVKYQHEAVKWTNTSYLGHSAVVWGSVEKSLKVAQQLECGQVSINSWMPDTSQELFGHKQSSFGMLDAKWSGSFYSDVKEMTGDQ